MPAYEPFLINPQPVRRHHMNTRRRRGRKRKMSALQKHYFGGGNKRRRSRRKSNPMGEEVMIVGNPRKRRRARRKKGSSRRRRFFGFESPVRYRSNPRRSRSHRRSRRNPAIPAVSLRRPFSIIPIVVTGGASAIATTAAPKLLAPMIGEGTWQKYGSQMAVALVGGGLIGNFLGGTHGVIWTVVGLAVMGGQILNEFLLAPAGIVYGVGAYPYGRLGRTPGSDFFLPSREDEGVPIGMIDEERVY